MAMAAAIPAVVGGLFSLFGGERRNRAEERFAANRHQVEVADLRAAGLNPVLSGTGGAGAPMPDVEDSVSPAVNSAFAVKLQQQELRNMKRQEQLLGQQELKTRIEAINARTQGEITARFGPDQASSALDAQRIANELALRQVPIAQIQEQMWKSAGSILATGLDKIGAANSAADWMRLLRNLGQIPGGSK